MSQSIYSRVRVSAAAQRRLERQRQRRLEEARRRNEAERRRQEAARRQLAAAEHRAAIQQESERVAAEQEILRSSPSIRRTPTSTPRPNDLAERIAATRQRLVALTDHPDSIREIGTLLQKLASDPSPNPSYINGILDKLEERIGRLESAPEHDAPLAVLHQSLLKLAAQLEVVAQQGFDAPERSIVRHARMLLALTENTLRSNDPILVRAELDRLTPQVTQIWDEFSERSRLADEQHYVLETVREALTELGYEVTTPAHRQHPDPASPVYIQFAKPASQQIQLGVSASGDMVSEVIAAGNDRLDEDAWCRDYDRLADQLARHGIDCEVKLRDGGGAKESPSIRQPAAVSTAPSVAMRRGSK